MPTLDRHLRHCRNSECRPTCVAWSAGRGRPCLPHGSPDPCVPSRCGFHLGPGPWKRPSDCSAAGQPCQSLARRRPRQRPRSSACCEYLARFAGSSNSRRPSPVAHERPGTRHHKLHSAPRATRRRSAWHYSEGKFSWQGSGELNLAFSKPTISGGEVAGISRCN